MKKYLALIIGMLFVFGFAVSAFADAVTAKDETKITLGGDLRVRGEFQQNTSDFNDDAADHQAYYDERVRLNVDAQVTPSTQGYIQLESGSGTNDTYVWDTGNSKVGSMDIREAWILHKGSDLLGVPAGVKVGHMPLSLGNKIFFDHTKFGDDALVFFVDPTKDLHVGLLTIKLSEGGTDTAAKIASDDTNAYVALFNYKLASMGESSNISGDITYLDDQAAASVGETHLANFGLRGNFDVKPLTIRADVELQTGTTNIDLADEADLSGFAGLLGLDYKMDPVTLTLEFAYGSGQDLEETDVNAFITSLGSDQHYTYVYEYRTISACGAKNTGLCNTMYVKGGVAGNLTPNITASLNLFWLEAVEEVVTDGDTDIGVEIDPKISYKIDKNLTYFVEGGYLVAGDFWGDDTDNAYAVRHGIQLSF